MSSWKGKTRGGVLGYSIFIFTINNLGIGSAYALLYFVAFYYWIFSRKRYLRYYFRDRLGYSSMKTSRSIYRLYYRFGQVLIDKVVLLGGNKKVFTFDLDGDHNLRNMKEGGMLIGAHMGNWEIASQLLHGLPQKIYIVMYDEEHQRIKSLLDNVMKEKTFDIIPIKNDLSHIIAIHRALQEKGLVVMHGDRFVEGSKTFSVPVLGHEAKLPIGPFHLAVKSGFPVTFVFAMKETSKHYHFYASEPKKYLSSAAKPEQEAFAAVAKDYIAELEEKVRKYPEHWFNFHDFWGIDEQ